MLQRLYSPKHPLGRVNGLQPSTLFPVALFSHPGYTNMLFADLNTDGTKLACMRWHLKRRSLTLPLLGVALGMPAVAQLRVRPSCIACTAFDDLYLRPWAFNRGHRLRRRYA